MDKTQERIKADAEAKYPVPVKFSDQVAAMERREGYIAGATVEASRAEPLVDMLEGIRAFIAGATTGPIDTKSKILKSIDVQIEAVLVQWKSGKPDRPCPHCGKELSRDRNLCCRECGEEVEPTNDKCRCVQPNWNAFTGKCLTCGKP